jgi:hypothetical protein
MWHGESRQISDVSGLFKIAIEAKKVVRISRDARWMSAMNEGAACWI